MSDLPQVSVIIPTLNEEKNIRRCLISIIENQTYLKNKIEIIIIDNGSTDRTIELAREYADRVFNLSNYVSLKRIVNYRGAQLNLGVKKARGKIIFFPDADMTFAKSLIAEATDLIFNRNYDALYVPEVVMGKGLFGKVRNFERSFYNQTCIDAVRIVKRDIFLKVGGFDTKIDFGPDDWDFTKTLKKYNYRLGITKNMFYHHEEQMTWDTYIDKKSNYFDLFGRYIKKWGKDDPDIRKQFGIRYRLFGVFFENGKWEKIFNH
ncbi:glycosyltransferase, partial [Candidatus Gottesmanbacteria bacterium]|nr:glycosyltransferase [Candidatus Gottesmanbacteria bacterium]